MEYIYIYIYQTSSLYNFYLIENNGTLTLFFFSSPLLHALKYIGAWGIIACVLCLSCCIVLGSLSSGLLELSSKSESGSFGSGLDADEAMQSTHKFFKAWCRGLIVQGCGVK